MITWYSDEELEIIFDKVPKVTMRYVTPFTTEEEKKEINKKPFINLEELCVVIKDKIEIEEYKFFIPKDYCWNGANIPRIFWRLIGSMTDNRFLIGSMIHDFICENHDIINNNRALSTDVFNALLKTAKVNPISRFFMKNSVAMFQTLFCRW